MLRTRAESSGFRETSLHADVMAFVEALDARHDPRLHTTTFGTSPQGRAMPLLVLSKDGVKTPEDARRTDRPVVLVVDGIHPGEVEGKEASLALVRDLLDGQHAGLLDHITLLFVPLFNPDGNDALDPRNRALDVARLEGQPGPVVGTRTQSHGINLNRDYMRMQTPEMRAFQQQVCQPWAPELTLDNHATNGSVHRMDMTVDIPHTVASGRSEPVEFMRERLVPDVIRAVERRGFLSGWYGNFVEDERAMDARVLPDPTARIGEGWMTYPHHPRFGSNYRGLTNRLDLLLECYSYLPFERRVQTASAWQLETLAWANEHADDIRQVVASSRTPPPRVAVRYRLEVRDTPVTIPTCHPRTLSGAPTTVTLPHLARFVGDVVVDRPAAYLVPPALADHLRLHGLAVEPAAGTTEVDVATVEGTGAETGRRILEAAEYGDLSVSWKRDTRTVPAGWSRVPTDQPLGAVAVYLCEPESDDGAAENGIVSAQVGEEYPAWRAHS
jgi:hypothetical protein